MKENIRENLQYKDQTAEGKKKNKKIKYLLVVENLVQFVVLFE